MPLKYGGGNYLSWNRQMIQIVRSGWISKLTSSAPACFVESDALNWKSSSENHVQLQAPKRDPFHPSKKVCQGSSWIVIMSDSRILNPLSFSCFYFTCYVYNIFLWICLNGPKTKNSRPEWMTLMIKYQD